MGDRLLLIRPKYTILAMPIITKHGRLSRLEPDWRQDEYLKSPWVSSRVRSLSTDLMDFMHFPVSRKLTFHLWRVRDWAQARFKLSYFGLASNIQPPYFQNMMGLTGNYINYELIQIYRYRATSIRCEMQKSPSPRSSIICDGHVPKWIGKSRKNVRKKVITLLTVIRLDNEYPSALARE